MECRCEGLRRVLWTLALCCAVAKAHAQVPQRPAFRLTATAEGLPSTSITALATDRTGYLWLTTYDGLARFDGTEFTVWQHDPRDPASVAGNLQQALYVDPHDQVWVASAGLSVLDAGRRGFRHYRRAQYPQMRSDDVYAIAGLDDHVWFGTNGGGLYRIDADGALTRFDHANTGGVLPSDVVTSLAVDARGRLWVGTEAGLAYVQAGRLHALPAGGPGALAVLSLTRVGDTLWAGTRAGPRVLGRDEVWRTPAWSAMFEGANQILAVADAGDGESWLGTANGLWLTHGARAPQWVRDRDGLFDRHFVTSFQAVAGGGLWMGVVGKGLAYLRPDWRRMAVLPAAKGTSISPYCSVAPGRHGVLWQTDAAGTLEQVDSRSGAVTVTAFRGIDPLHLGLTSAVQDRRGALWLGVRPAVLVRLDLATGARRDWPLHSAGQVAFAPETLLEDARGDLWLGTPGAVQRRDGRSGEVLDAFARHPVTGHELAFQQLRLGPDGEPWIASGTGLLRWESATRRLLPVDGPDGALEVSGFVPESAQALWVFRIGELERWQWHEGRWQLSRRIEAGLPNVTANGMQRDGQGRLWLATQRGLLRVDVSDPQRVVVRTFGVRDGLSSQEFLEKCLYRLESGVLASTTSDGALVLIDPATPDRTAISPPLLLRPPTVVREGRIEALPASTPRLRPDDRELRVGVRLLAFDDVAGSRYRSRLLGLDPDWVDQGASGDRVLSALAPGDYTLALQGFDASGNASAVHRLHFSVAPPWWRSVPGLLALSLLGLCLLLAGAWAYRRRVQRRSAWQMAQHRRVLAEQASQAKTHFLATLGHEVRTPMTGVLGMSELLAATPLDANQRGYVAAIQKAGTHLLRLVNDALDLARIEAGRLALDVQDFDLRELLGEVAALIAPNAERKGLAFDWQVDADVPRALRGDPLRVRQIAMNLLGNAVKFTARGRVALHVQAAEAGVVLIVSDTGPGMSAEQQTRLFQRFEQAEGARTTARYGGSGLGLAICQELAQAMGGRITVDSAPGQGTRFLAYLPLPAAADTLVPAVRDRHARQVQPLSVLLVEDDPTVAAVISGLLQTRGHRVRAVAHGLAALTEARVERFDIALLDLDLPGLDGLALATQLRAQGLDLPLLAVTARADAEAEPLARAAGFDGFLRKPVTGDLLEEAIAALCR
ncbi:ATP-binding protein [Pseudoxanthomonas sp. UC19_8]|uniref:hybrid sensor histidine kinase/response regulator n=1 Tax=Pseudoxanthomonas sp. UC19_8 TaxID=3350175 RepID=UPI0036D41642